eukprot:gene177-790_t
MATFNNRAVNKIYQTDVKRNGIFSDFLNYFCKTIKQVDSLFNLLFKNRLYYGGSYYDGSRIVGATEFYLDIILRFPFQKDIIFDTSSEPGYAFVGLSRPLDQLISVNDPNYATYKKIDRFISEDNKFVPEEICNWFEIVCTIAVKRMRLQSRSRGSIIKSVRIRKSGPVLTLEIQQRKCNLPMIRLNLVPVIPKESFFRDVMYCVPKPHQRNDLLWRCSYPDRERAILEDSGCAKMVIKLLNKMRDSQEWHCLANYYLKTVVMLSKGDAVWSQNQVEYYFITSLEKLSFCLDQRKIPFYHDHDCNLLEAQLDINMAILNEVLHEIYQEDLKLNREKTQELTGIFNRFIDYFLKTMKQVDPLFNLLFKNNIHYGGSYYDGLRIGEATEFDLDIILRFPFQEDIVFDTSSVPGNVYVGLSRPVDQLIPMNNPNYPTYKKIDKFIGEDNKFMPRKVRNWFEGVSSKARDQVMGEIMKFCITGLKLRKSGPALTLEIRPLQHHLPMISVDLVPVIQKGSDVDVMYCVPKSNQRNALLWRCSYPNRERAILKDSGCAKMVIKLLKNIRDKQGWHSLASYYLKTVVMLMLSKGDEFWPQSRMGEYFIATLEKLSFFLDQGEIPFFHGHGCNLLENVNTATLANINGGLKRIIQDFQTIQDPVQLITFAVYLLLEDPVVAFYFYVQFLIYLCMYSNLGRQWRR